jgi:hypothetical protein
MWFVLPYRATTQPERKAQLAQFLGMADVRYTVTAVQVDAERVWRVGFMLV